ncbi:transcriptional regulator with PAS/PAC sensors, AraC family [Beutenbergia cavernae DSM 12333]|uniref:Transcriptional regulator with PAS/PAC sensors, AraC family n=1 Tax=Beutenbergia cavernae (strain ATCC BAA-8 / DSM 12333 / CCUG 43141 / JCM 11478 / NBRC 16432 / NCIMB 13614 / HKI 0122) TaxID=471853 RepID=C5BYY1_BEUC1|nr:AraC family transcriptional regulator [Beutenbergia cavernae]ACQ81096.1 transcriptional regulator with PAS/PAC sensors, AraC family [Beutenbergia cavernae DSM 12333]
MTNDRDNDGDDGDAAALGARDLGPALLALMDELTVTMFCAKDTAGRYVAVNPTFVRRAGERSRRAVLGRRAEDLFVAPLAERYSAQDARVLAGAELRNELELIRSLHGQARWHLTTKLPVRQASGAVVGLVSISQDLGEQRADDASLASLARVVERIHARPGDVPSVADLAREAGCSPGVLARRVRRVFQLSPGQLVLRARIDHAAGLLAGTDTPIAEIAQASGFYDQAAFSRTFARLSGETPAQFRRRERRVTRP